MELRSRPSADNSAMELVCVGEFDLGAVPAWRSVVLELLRDGWSSIVVDLTEVTFIDSAGLGALIGLRRRCRDAQGALTLIPSPEVSRVLEAAEIEALFSSSVGPR